MAGIYVHIPFCKQACHYCDFHFSTSLKTKDALLDALLHEITLQKNYLTGQIIETIYFGGGTPTLLNRKELQRILDQLRDKFTISPSAEVTIESNPDDLTLEKLIDIKEAGFNRLSIGIQSFDDELLKFYNRAHDSKMAVDSVRNAQKLGFDNITVDIIFGAPNQSLEALEIDLKKALGLDTPHISVYGLTIEEKTVFGKWNEKGTLPPVDEEIAATHFELIMKVLQQKGFEQYEISNFAKPGFESKHNSAYWKSTPYLGIGPSAHSYNGVSRQYNVSNNTHYIKQLAKDRIPCKIEILSHEDQINETILIQMRTAQGLDLDLLKDRFSFDLLTLKEHEVESLKTSNKVQVENNFLKFTDSGKLLADFIIEKLII